MKKTVSIIAAMSKDRVIGVDNKLPWHLPADLKFFKQITSGHTVIMGRKTFESIGCKPLPNRKHIVVSRQPDYAVPTEVRLVHSVEEAIELGKKEDDEPFVLGGAQIYEKALLLTDKIYLTEIDIEVKGDAFFPNLDPRVWKLTKKESHSPDEKNPHAFKFLVYERV